MGKDAKVLTRYLIYILQSTKKVSSKVENKYFETTRGGPLKIHNDPNIYISIIKLFTNISIINYLENKLVANIVSFETY